MKLILRSLFLLFLLTGVIEADAQRNHWLSVGLGGESTAIRDFGFSPLIYDGWQLSYNINFKSVKASRSDYFFFNYANGKMTNDFGRSMDLWSASFRTFTFYHPGDKKEKGIHWGWSNVNFVQHRQHEDVSNFNGRSDYFTSFGPSFRWIQPLRFKGMNLTLEVKSHSQLIGFMLLPGFVSSSPSGFVDNSISGIQPFLQSIDWYVPGKAWHFSTMPSLTWLLNSGNRIRLNYQFEFIQLNGIHRSQRAGSTYSISLISQL